MPLRLCFLALLLPSMAAAAGSDAGCAASLRGKLRRTPSLLEVLECQKTERKSSAGSGLSPSDLQRLEIRQREEVHAFLKRHPEKATLDRDPATEEPTDMLSYLKYVYRHIRGKLSWVFGKPERPRAPASARGSEEDAEAEKTLARFLDDLKEGGLDKRLKEDLDGVQSGKYRKRAEHLAETLQNYEKRRKANSDPAMEKYYKKWGEKD